LVRGAAAAAQNIDFAGNGTLALFTPQSFAATIANFAPGDTIELIGLAANAVVTGSMVGSVLDLAGSVPNGTTIAFDNPPPGIVLQPVAGITKTYDIVVPPLPCFAEGTQLLTPCGMRPVEALRKGDQVITRAGVLSVIWHGRRRVDCMRHPTPTKVWPVRIERDAFGPGLPVRPLFLSPDHALFSDGALIPVQFLLNGITIRQEPVASVTYHHIELERHEIVWAENLPTESYLDCGNRHQFGEAAGEAEAANVEVESLTTESASPGGGILHEARASGARGIVMGTTSHTAGTDTVLSHAVEEVLGQSPVPVVVVVLRERSRSPQRGSAAVVSTRVL